MQQNNQTAAFTQQTKITFPAAKKAVESMNLINGFLFDSSIEDEEDAKIVIGAILTTVFNREINDLKVTSQKIIQPIDSMYHGIRLDAYVTEDKSGKISANVYDVEVENCETESLFKTHTNIHYKNEITHIYLYSIGKINDDLDASHSKNLLKF